MGFYHRGETNPSDVQKFSGLDYTLLRRRDESMSDEGFLYKLGKREAGLSVMGPGSSQVYRTAAALEVSLQPRPVNSARRCRR
jgi:hypothetical protein